MTALDELHQLDLSVYAAIAETSTPTFDVFMRRLSHAANYSRIWGATAAALALTCGEPGRRAARYGLVSVGVTSAVTNLLVKQVARRPRPERATVPEVRHVPMPDTHSFPSGHSASAFAFATGVGHAMPHAGAGVRVLALMVAYSRVHTGVHYPGDAVVGSLLGTVLAQASVSVIERVRET